MEGRERGSLSRGSRQSPSFVNVVSSPEGVSCRRRVRGGPRSTGKSGEEKGNGRRSQKKGSELGASCIPAGDGGVSFGEWGRGKRGICRIFRNREPVRERGFLHQATAKGSETQRRLI